MVASRLSTITASNAHSHRSTRADMGRHRLADLDTANRLRVNHITNQIQRSPFAFQIGFAHVFANDADGQQLNAPQKRDQGDERREAGHHSAEQHRFTLDVNVAGTLQMCLAALPYLKQSRSPRVLNMSSASALYGVPHLASYSASKFAVRGLTEALDLEWRRHGIRVQDLMPPFVNTGMVNKQTFEAPVVRRMGVKLSADDVARAAFDTLQGDPRVHVPVGLPFRFTVLLEKVVPQRATRALMAWLSRD